MGREAKDEQEDSKRPKLSHWSDSAAGSIRWMEVPSFMTAGPRNQRWMHRGKRGDVYRSTLHAEGPSACERVCAITMEAEAKGDRHRFKSA